ncbi:MAG TPA: hypothetical protein VGE45_20600 [Chloroflexia bacterium]
MKSYDNISDCDKDASGLECVRRESYRFVPASSAFDKEMEETLECPRFSVSEDFAGISPRWLSWGVKSDEVVHEVTSLDDFLWETRRLLASGCRAEDVLNVARINFDSALFPDIRHGLTYSPRLRNLGDIIKWTQSTILGALAIDAAKVLTYGDCYEYTTYDGSDDAFDTTASFSALISTKLESLYRRTHYLKPLAIAEKDESVMASTLRKSFAIMQRHLTWNESSATKAFKELVDWLHVRIAPAVKPLPWRRLKRLLRQLRPGCEVIRAVKGHTFRTRLCQKGQTVGWFLSRIAAKQTRKMLFRVSPRPMRFVSEDDDVIHSVIDRLMREVARERGRNSYGEAQG